MNDRIKSILIGCTRPHSENIVNPPYFHGSIDYEKFAELIIRECNNVLYDTEIIINANGGVEHPESILLSHFGITE